MVVGVIGGVVIVVVGLSMMGRPSKNFDKGKHLYTVQVVIRRLKSGKKEKGRP